MRYEILGELRIENSGALLTLTRKCETLIAVLLVNANRVVGAEQLINEIWGDKPPRRATSALYVYVSQLRKLLRSSSDRKGPIITRPHGYMLRVEGEELDADEFRWRAEQGQAFFRTEQYAEAAKSLESALDLWRGPVFGESFGGPLIQAYSTWLAENRLECLELLLEAELRSGRHREVIGRLYALTTEYPLREKFCQQLMLALYRSDRRAEALEVYRVADAKLRNEVGIDPCPALRELHQSILLGDMQLATCTT